MDGTDYVLLTQQCSTVSGSETPRYNVRLWSLTDHSQTFLSQAHSQDIVLLCVLPSLHESIPMLKIGLNLWGEQLKVLR